jgi:transcriptional regulator with XRE-family HTH domain
MNMNANNDKLKDKLNSLMSSLSEEDVLDVDKRVLSARFLSEIQKCLDVEEISRKDFAKKMNTSASFITQLFTGNKVVSMEFLAKAQKELNIDFQISAVSLAEMNLENCKIVPLSMSSSAYNDIKNDNCINFWNAESTIKGNYRFETLENVAANGQY